MEETRFALPPPPEDKGYGQRLDGTPKGTGFLGAIPMDDGSDMTEMSIGVDMDGQETQIPSIVPTLDADEIRHLAGGGQVTTSIVDKAFAHAQSRMKSGKSPFADNAETPKWKKWDESRAVPPKKFREVSRNVLSKLTGDTGRDLTGRKAEELLGMTAAQESNMGRYLHAPGTSAQRGVMQITDATAKDIMRYAERDPKLLNSLNSFRRHEVPIEQDLEDNLPLSIAMARIKYAMDPKPVPGTDPQALAEYYKRVYNSYGPAAKATTQKAVDNYKRFFAGQ